jgi:hypothetical protein
VSTTWALFASQVCGDALRHLNVIGKADTPSGALMQDALRGLDVVLKELPLHGYTWPKLSAEVALVWTGLQTVALPADYYGYPVVWQTQNGQRSRLIQCPHALWVQASDSTAAGTASQFYVSPDNVLHLWAVPTVDPVLTMQYLRRVDDADLFVTPDVLQSMLGALSYGVADEIALKCGVPQEVRVEVAARWKVKRDLMLANAVPYEVISFGVAG